MAVTCAMLSLALAWVLVPMTSEGGVLSMDKGVIVHLLEWTYSDIAQECEQFLAPYGYKAVQISPPSENVEVWQPPRPWWERYQPISYQLVTRSGDRRELEDMVDRCNSVGVRVFADVVLNHMTGGGRSAVGVGGSTAAPDSYSYPAVPYTPSDFHIPTCEIKNYNNATEVRVCQVMGLRDLNNTAENVRNIQVDYLNTLVDLGIAGFRIQAAKHMFPEDLKIIFGRVKNLNSAKGFPPNTRPFIYQEVIDMGEEAVTYEEYAPLGLVTDFRYGKELGRSFQGHSHLVYLKNFGLSWNLLPDDTGLVFVDNHETQRKTDDALLHHKKARPYKMAIAFMLAFPYGTPQLLSSYLFDSYDQGPPHDSDHHILSPHPDKDNVCSNGWACEHRWRQVYNMVLFHNTVKGSDVREWWDNGRDQIAFCRGNKGFIAFNRETSALLNEKLQTCLPKGIYCDVISGSLVNNDCTGRRVEVGADGEALITIEAFDLNDPNKEKDNVLAIHVKAAIFYGQFDRTGAPATADNPPDIPVSKDTETSVTTGPSAVLDNIGTEPLGIGNTLPFVESKDTNILQDDNQPSNSYSGVDQVFATGKTPISQESRGVEIRITDKKEVNPVTNESGISAAGSAQEIPESKEAEAIISDNTTANAVNRGNAIFAGQITQEIPKGGQAETVEAEKTSTDTESKETQAGVLAVEENREILESPGSEPLRADKISGNPESIETGVSAGEKEPRYPESREIGTPVAVKIPAISVTESLADPDIVEDKMMTARNTLITQNEERVKPLDAGERLTIQHSKRSQSRGKQTRKQLDGVEKVGPIQRLLNMFGFSS